jgi:Zn-dependent M28 family amino/carboxypeptidase
MRHDSEQKVCAVGFVDTFAFILRNSEIRTGHSYSSLYYPVADTYNRSYWFAQWSGSTGKVLLYKPVLSLTVTALNRYYKRAIHHKII